MFSSGSTQEDFYMATPSRQKNTGGSNDEEEEEQQEQEQNGKNHENNANNNNNNSNSGNNNIKINKNQQFRVSILSNSTKSDGGSKPYTVYLIEIFDSFTETSWQVSKRYKEFEKINDQLLKLFGKTVPQLPPKKLFGNRNAQFVDQRKHDLEKYLQELVTYKFILEEQLVIDFLQLYKAKEIERKKAPLKDQASSGGVSSQSSSSTSPSSSSQISLPNKQEIAAKKEEWIAQVEELLRFLSDSIFDDHRLKKIWSVCDSQCFFTCAQILRILNFLDFPDAKVSVAGQLGLRAIDPESRSLILEQIDFESDKKAIKKLWR